MEIRKFLEENFKHCELLNLKEIKDGKPVAYMGFERSNTLHLGSVYALLHMLKLKECFEIKILLANFFAYLNKKGTYEEIELKTKIMKESLTKMGFEEREMIISTDYLVDLEYLKKVFNLSLASKTQKVKKSFEIMGRGEEDQFVSTYLYAICQIADVEYLGVDLAVGGMDQRKIHVLAHEQFKLLNKKLPSYLHFPILPSLDSKKRMGKEIQKMSKSGIQGQVLYITDTPEEIRAKVNRVYFDEKEDNRVEDLCRKIYALNLNTSQINTNLFDIKRTNAQEYKEKFSIAVSELFKIFK